MDIQGNYKLFAFEPENGFEPANVEFVKTIRCGDRDDLIWAKSDSLLGGGHVILASRHEGDSLLDIVGFPIHVYICLPKRDDIFLADIVPADEISIKYWGLLLDVADERTDLATILFE